MRNYRGLTKDGKWVYGSLIKTEKHTYIWEPHNKQHGHAITKISYKLELYPTYKVIPETVGQQVGLKDKKGKEIYKGDTLKNPKDPRGNGLFDVAWSEMFHGWIGNSQTECLQMKACMFDESEIIGNIHQPEEQDNA